MMSMVIVMFSRPPVWTLLRAAGCGTLSPTRWYFSGDVELIIELKRLHFLAERD
jgi:hypothetical protein